MDEQVKERDEKYNDLDSKFNRLHKRAKQRIQEVQKVTQSLGSFNVRVCDILSYVVHWMPVTFWFYVCFIVT